MKKLAVNDFCTAFFFVFAFIIYEQTELCKIPILQGTIIYVHTVDIKVKPCYNFCMEISQLEQFEQELGVELFSHGKNKTELNEFS